MPRARRFLTSLALCLAPAAGSAQSGPDPISCPSLTLFAPYDQAAVQDAFAGVYDKSMPVPEDFYDDPEIDHVRLMGFLAYAFPDRVEIFHKRYSDLDSVLLMVAVRSDQVVAYHCGQIVTP